MISFTWNNVFAPTVLALTLAVLLAPAADAQNRRRSGSDPQPKKEKASLSIVQVGEELRILPGKDVTALRKELADSHKAELKDWKKDKAEAKKAKVPFTDKKPAAPVFKVVKTGIPDRDLAEKLRTELMEKMVAKTRAAIRYVVVEQDEALSVMTSTQAEETKKRLAEDHKAALKDHAASKKAAAKEGKPFDLPKPPKPKFRIVSTRFKSETEAVTALEKQQEKQSKRKGAGSTSRS